MRRDKSGCSERNGPDFWVHPLEQNRFDESEGFRVRVLRWRDSNPESIGQIKDPDHGNHGQNPFHHRQSLQQGADAEPRDGRDDANPNYNTRDMRQCPREAKSCARCRDQDHVWARGKQPQKHKSNQRRIKQGGLL